MLCFSYHALFDLHYESQLARTAVAKKLAPEMNMSVREAVRWLDAYLFLDEIPLWWSGRPHCPYLLQKMFSQVESMGCKEYNHAGQRGSQQSMLEQEATQEVLATELVGYKTSQEEMFILYQEVYQLKRAPGLVLGDPEKVEGIHQEILNSLKDYLQLKWGPAQPEDAPRQRSNTSAQAKFHSHMKAAYDHFGQILDKQQKS